MNPPILTGASKIEATIDQVVIVTSQLAGQFAHFEVPRAGRPDERHFGRRAGNETLLETFQFIRPDRAFADLDAMATGEIHHRLAGDAVKEAVGRRRMERAI